MTDDYEVGFGKPPKHTQFQKGRSGNPNGRPKGSKSISVLIRRALEAKVIAKGPDGSCSMTKLEAALLQLANKGANGELKAIEGVVRLGKELQEREPYLHYPTFQVNFVKSQWELDQEKAAEEEAEGKDHEGGTA